MILKIRSSSPGVNWHFVDHIERLTMSHKFVMALSEFKKRVYRAQDIFYIQPRLEWEETPAGLQPVDVGRDCSDVGFHFFEAYCTDAEGNEFTVVFDGDGFLMNDFGKTIDKFIIYDNP